MLILASISAMSLLCTVLKITVSYHERRRDRPNETLATLYHKEGAKFYFIRHFPVLKIDNTNTLLVFLKTFPDNLQYLLKQILYQERIIGAFLQSIVPAFAFISPFHCEDTGSIGANEPAIVSFWN